MFHSCVFDELILHIAHITMARMCLVSAANHPFPDLVVATLFSVCCLWTHVYARNSVRKHFSKLSHGVQYFAHLVLTIWNYANVIEGGLFYQLTFTIFITGHDKICWIPYFHRWSLVNQVIIGRSDQASANQAWKATTTMWLSTMHGVNTIIYGASCINLSNVYVLENEIF